MVNGFVESWAAALGTGGVFAGGLQIWSSAKLYFRFFKKILLPLPRAGSEGRRQRSAITDHGCPTNT
jgi:hypothetical protein